MFAQLQWAPVEVLEWIQPNSCTDQDVVEPRRTCWIRRDLVVWIYWIRCQSQFLESSGQSQNQNQMRSSCCLYDMSCFAGHQHLSLVLVLCFQGQANVPNSHTDSTGTPAVFARETPQTHLSSILRIGRMAGWPLTDWKASFLGGIKE